MVHTCVCAHIHACIHAHIHTQEKEGRKEKEEPPKQNRKLALANTQCIPGFKHKACFKAMFNFKVTNKILPLWMLVHLAVICRKYLCKRFNQTASLKLWDQVAKEKRMTFGFETKCRIRFRGLTEQVHSVPWCTSLAVTCRVNVGPYDTTYCKVITQCSQRDRMTP